MTNQPTPQQMEEIRGALASGRRIEAIKMYRGATGEGLKESKEFIDALISSLKEQDPENYAKLSAQGAGCALAALLCVGLTVAGIAWLFQSMT